MNQEQNNKIEGFLLLFALGVVLSPFKWIWGNYELYTYVTPFELIDLYSEPMENAKLLVLLVGTEMIYNALMFLASLVGAYLFFQKKSFVPAYFTVILLLGLIVPILDNYAASQLLPDQPSFEKDEMMTMARSLFYACIWIPYLWLSENSKKVFIHPLRPGMIPDPSARLDAQAPQRAEESDGNPTDSP